MNRSYVWVATLAAAAMTTVAEARAFTLQGSGGSKLEHLVAGPELHAPAPGIAKPTPGQSDGYSFSGNSFNLSVTKTGRATPEPPKVAAPSADPSANRPGFFRRMLDWITGD